MDPVDARDLEFEDALGELHSLVLGVAKVETFLEEVAGLAATSMDASVACGITTSYDARPLTCAASDPRAAIVDEEQYGAGEGPCLEAMRSGQVVDVPDQGSDHRWETYRRAALDLDVRCSLSLPLFLDRRSVGALNLYSFEAAGTFRGAARLQAEVFAGHASTALTMALRFTDQEARSRQLVEALHARSVIDQAIGIVMVQQPCDSETAFDLLRQRSQRGNRKLREVAADVVHRASGHPASGPQPFVEPRGPRSG